MINSKAVQAIPWWVWKSDVGVIMLACLIRERGDEMNHGDCTEDAGV